MKKKEQKRVAALFFTSHADNVGNAYRINRLRSLSKRYHLFVITNFPQFIKDNIPDCQVFNISFNFKSTYFNYLRWFLSVIKLQIMCFDLLYYFHNDSPVAFFGKTPKLCEIHQSHEIIGIGENKSLGIKSKLKKVKTNFNAFLLIHGIKKADHSFTVSEQLKEFFVGKGINSNKIEYLPHGVDTSLFNTKDAQPSRLLEHVPKKSFIMIYTGWVGEKRGLTLMLEGLLLIKKEVPNIHLIIVGNQDADKENIKKYAQDNNLDHNISLFGRLSYSEMPSLIIKADVCLSFLEVNQSYSMSPPQKIFEYFAMGKPVVANRIPTHTDYIKDGYNGKIINDLQPEQFSKVIIQLVENNKQYCEMCENALAYSKHYNMELIEKRLIAKIDKLMLNE